ncbi:MAG: type II toxin-antitoxin system PemK/MazF family toxin [Patescibacteria group bacterium]
MDYKKDFDKWNKEKRSLDTKENFPYANEREIWWCSLGVNVGSEIDGKNDNFERPIVVLKVYNKDMLLVLPLSTKYKNNPFYFKISISDGKHSYAILSQMRIISSKRLIRKIERLPENSFGEIIKAYKDSI